MTVLVKYPKEENPKGTRAVILSGGDGTWQRMGPLCEVPVDQQAQLRDPTALPLPVLTQHRLLQKRAPAGAVSPLECLQSALQFSNLMTDEEDFRNSCCA